MLRSASDTIQALKLSIPVWNMSKMGANTKFSKHSGTRVGNEENQRKT